MSAADDFSAPRPFRVDVPVEEVQRMRRLIEDTRLPDSPPVPGATWNYGADLDWLKGLRDEWLNNFDWKQVEEEMNQFKHFKVIIESIDVHFIHHTSERPDAIPIILFHGWPGAQRSYAPFISITYLSIGSFWEFHRTIGLLTNPPADQPAFHVVVPSLPGFGFSSPPPKQKWGMNDNARIFDRLMTGVLGYKAYMAAGGDFGGVICKSLGTDKYPACKLLNTCTPPCRPTGGAIATLPFFILPKSWRSWLYSKIYTDEERHDLGRFVGFVKTGFGYFIQQSTRPLTIGYALHDSPVGVLAWIGDKYRDLVDPEILPESTKFILTTISIYYLTNTFASSTLPYRDNPLGKAFPMTKPHGCSLFAHDIGVMPVSWIKAQYRDLVFAHRHARGGHFPGYEVPDLLVADIQELATARRSLL